MTTLPFVIEPEIFAQLPRLPHWLVLDLSSEGSYRSGHIEGAIWLPVQALLLGTAPMPGKLPSLEQLTQVFNYLGLTPQSHVVVVDDEGGGWAGRLIWTLHLLGHSAISYINGGMRAWQSAGLPVRGEISQPTASHQQYSLDTSQLVSAEAIMANLDHWHIWDARSPAEYTGHRPASARSGHIPGAINCEWTELMDPARSFRIRLDAQARLQELGLDGSRPIVTHCQSHHRSGFTYLVGKYLGLNIRAYDGSWAEWGNRTDTPIES